MFSRTLHTILLVLGSIADTDRGLAALAATLRVFIALGTRLNYFVACVRTEITISTYNVSTPVVCRGPVFSTGTCST